MTLGTVRRIVALALGLVLAEASSATAQEARPPRPIGELVGEAVTSFEAKKEKPFAALLAAIDADFVHDPWLLADRLAAKGRLDVARALAAAAKGPRWDGLGAYLSTADASHARMNEIERYDSVIAAGAPVLELTEGLATGPVPHTVLALDSLRHRADALLSADRGPEAIALARVVASRAKTIGWSAGELGALRTEGIAAQSPPQLDVLLAANLRAAELAGRLGDALEEGRAHSDVAVVHAMSGSYAAAVDALERGAAAFDRAPPSGTTTRRRAIHLLNLGQILAKIGEAGEARITLDRAVGMLRAAGADPADAGDAELVRAATFSQSEAQLLTGDVVGAMATLREFRKQAHAASDADALARASALEGAIHRESGEWALALDAFRAARDQFAGLADEALRLRAAASMGYCLRELGRAREAIDLLGPTIEAQAALPDPVVLPDARREIGEAHAAAGDLDQALAALRLSLAGALELGQREDAVRARIALAETLLAKGDAAGALAAASAAAEDVPRLVRDTALSDAAPTRRRWVRCYDAGLRAAVALGDAEAVVRFLEAGRSGALLEGLRGRAFAHASVDPELRRESASKHRARAGAELALADAVSDGLPLKDVAARRAALAAAEAAERDVIARIQRESRAAARLAYPSPVDATAARADLAEGEALVVYRALPERTVAAVLTRKATRFVSLAGAPAWQADAARIAVPDDPDTEARDAAAARLRDALVRPLDLGADTSRVLVSPDGALSTAPLCLLFPDLPLGLVPSATVLHELRAAPRASGRSVLAVGDPDYRREPRLAPLPGTRAEVAAFRDPKVTLLGGDATPAGVLAALAKGAPWRAVHLACHGVASSRDPWTSAVALSSTADAGGRLTAAEMAAAPFRADLVTLSACELGGGRVIDAEGAVGVPQALLIGGARCVLANLWRADDDAARVLMEAFYEEWRDGRCGAAEALRVAQAKVRSDSRRKDSRYWAGWILWGSPD